MWILRFYDPADDEMKLELALPAFDREEAASHLGFLPTRYGSTQLSASDLRVFEDRFGFKAPAGLMAYLDYDAPAETGARSTRIRVAATSG